MSLKYYHCPVFTVQAESNAENKQKVRTIKPECDFFLIFC